MKKLFPLLILLLISCAPDLSDYELTILSDSEIRFQEECYIDWVIRETATPSNTSIVLDTSFLDAAELAITSARRLAYLKSDPYYWQSSSESLQLKSGVCIDIAILAYMTLYNAGYPKEWIMIMCWKLYGVIGHAELAVFDGTWKIYIDHQWVDIPTMPCMYFGIDTLEFLD